ncbi:Ribonuclease H domain [Forsythia ovata]|uniref:Ribonuclease H domain n=1 Tax=Forsythia ovata TaxID=205694 RepID=A0ABD1QBJ6_9LAMI
MAVFARTFTGSFAVKEAELIALREGLEFADRLNFQLEVAEVDSLGLIEIVVGYDFWEEAHREVIRLDEFVACERRVSAAICGHDEGGNSENDGNDFASSHSQTIPSLPSTESFYE